MSDLARLRAHAKAIEKLPTAATWNFTTRERVVQRAREMLGLLDGAVLLSAEEAAEAIALLQWGCAFAPDAEWRDRFRQSTGALLASPRPEGEQA